VDEDSGQPHGIWDPVNSTAPPGHAAGKLLDGGRVGMIRNLTLPVLLAIAGITGAAGQAVLLFHDLVDCYPYKMMSNPPDGFYKGIAYLSLALTTAAAAFAGPILLRRVPYYTATVACVLCPLMFLLVFAVAHAILGVDMGNTANFDHTTPRAVFGDFARRALELVVAGGAIGAVCGLIAAVVFRVSGRPGSGS
jgi:hypothetical protein